MRKALILAYDFPPYNSIGGQRPYSWYKYFKQFGIEPTVVTRHWDLPILKPEDCYLPSGTTTTVLEESIEGKVIRVPFKPTLRDRLIPRTDFGSRLVRRTLSFLTIFLERFLPLLDNKRNIYREAGDLVRKENFDVIIATGEPFILFSYASRLSRKFNVPWIADYRDGWSTNYNSAGFTRTLNETFYRRIEKKTCVTAALITTAAPVFANEIRELLQLPEESVNVIYNGYLHELFEGLENVPEKETFHITHAGTLYRFQPVELFLKGLNLFLEKHPSAEIETTFFGLNFFPDQVQRIKASSGKATVNFTDRVPHRKMLEELASSQLQLLVATPEKHQIYGKVFDYLASGRPTLMVENDKGPLEWILSHQENSCSVTTAGEVADYIEELYFNQEKTKRLPRSENQFSRQKQAERFANLILETLNNQTA